MHWVDDKNEDEDGLVETRVAYLVGLSMSLGNPPKLSMIYFFIHFYIFIFHSIDSFSVLSIAFLFFQ